GWGGGGGSRTGSTSLTQPVRLASDVPEPVGRAGAGPAGLRSARDVLVDVPIAAHGAPRPPKKAPVHACARVTLRVRSRRARAVLACNIATSSTWAAPRASTRVSSTGA